ncbi:MAG: type II secretion system protein GspM [Deferrisomatales bacterium]
MRLSIREKAMLGTGGAFLLGVGFWLAVWEPAHAHLDLMARRVAAKRSEHRQIRELSERFERLQGRVVGIEAHLKRSKDFSILSYLESLARRTQLQDRIVQMKPKGGETTRYYRENGVEIKMEKIRLRELVQYLHEVENSPELLRVKQLQVRPRFDDADLLDVRFQVSAYELSEGG